MTDIKKKEAGKTAAKAKKLQLNKETLKDLSVSLGKGKQLKGGRKVAMSYGCVTDYDCATADC